MYILFRMPQVTVNLVPLKSDSEDKSNDGPDDNNDNQDQWSDHKCSSFII